jgi:hypothetical protein
MGTSEGKPGRSPRKEPNTIDCDDCDYRIAMLMLTPPAQPSAQQHRRCRGAASCRGPDAQHGLAEAQVSVMLSGLGVWRAHKLVWSTWQLSRVVNGIESRWVPARASLVGLREKCQTQSIILVVTMKLRCRCSRHRRSLSLNKIGDAGAQHLAEALARNTTLQTLM